MSRLINKKDTLIKMKCTQCGTCCKLFLINLNKEEYESGNYETELNEKGLEFNKAVQVGANILKQKKNGECIYLKNNKCSIHKTRPQVCREFFCDSKEEKYKGMIGEIKERKKLF